MTASWHNLGIALRLNNAELEKINKNKNGDSNECLRSMLVDWLRECYDTKKFGRPSWKLLCQAVHKRSGGNNPALARKIGDHMTAQNKSR